jgi:hypothetical protein
MRHGIGHYSKTCDMQAWGGGGGVGHLGRSRNRWRERLDDLGFEGRQGQEISSPKRSDRHRGHLASYSMSKGGSFLGAKVAGAWNCTSTPPVCLHAVCRDNFMDGMKLPHGVMSNRRVMMLMQSPV